MKQFNLEEYLKNPSKKIVTRDGSPVRIICTDRKDLDAPIVALVDYGTAEGESCLYYTEMLKDRFHPFMAECEFHHQ